jgi:glycosyltransferase involved in cell wall biosynthesis
MPSFKISTVNDKSGPGIFGSRLKDGLLKKGWTWDNVFPQYKVCFATGYTSPNSIDVLRLDNMYFDSENTIGDTDKLNAPILQAYNTFDKIVFQSEFAVEQYKHHFGPIKVPYKVIYNGVPKTFCKVGKGHNYGFAKTFMCSADWRAHKRLEPVIEAFKCFDKSLNYGLVIFGNCKHKDNHPNIRYPGKLHHIELPFAMRGIDAGIHISWLDCSPNVVYEMLGLGLPVLCSHNGGTKEIVRDDGITLKLEEDYQYNRVPLYKPPKPDIDLLYWGMQDILKKKVGVRPDLYMNHVVDEYVNFIMS